MCPESLLQLKNIDYGRLLVKNFVWYSSLIDELHFMVMDSSIGDEKADQALLHDINQLILRAENERNEIAVMVHKVYSESHPTDTLALNAVRRHRQDRMVAWQQDFDRLPNPKPPQQIAEKEKRPITTFGTVRNMLTKRPELLTLFDTPSRESDTESLRRQRRIVSEPSASTSESESVAGRLREKIAVAGPEVEAEVVELASDIAKLPPVDESLKDEGEESDDTIGASKAGLNSTDMVRALLSEYETSRDLYRMRAPQDHLGRWS